MLSVEEEAPDILVWKNRHGAVRRDRNKARGIFSIQRMDREIMLKNLLYGSRPIYDSESIGEAGE
jgi:hypothetical protein